MTDETNQQASDSQTVASTSSNQEAKNIATDLDVGMGALDAATLAAQQIGEREGFSKDADAMATYVQSLESRIKQIESVLPQLMEAYTTISQAVPQDWKDRVEKVVAAVEHRFSL